MQILLKHGEFANIISHSQNPVCIRLQVYYV